MSKSSKVKDILSIAKGLESSEKYGRGFEIENGTLILTKETETPDSVEVVSFIMRFDNTPINEFVSKVNRPKFKPSEAFMKRLEIQFTDHFKTKYIKGVVDDTSKDLIQYKTEWTDSEHPKTKAEILNSFPSREEDVIL